MRREYHFWTYITTNRERSVLYTGVTSNLAQRLKEHYDNRGDDKTFAGQYYCYNLVYYEYTTYINNAILREKEIKDLSRAKKLAMITAFNPDFRFLNVDFCGAWPPTFTGRLQHDESPTQKYLPMDDEEWWMGLTPPPMEE